VLFLIFLVSQCQRASESYHSENSTMGYWGCLTITSIFWVRVTLKKFWDSFFSSGSESESLISECVHAAVAFGLANVTVRS
jgi:hypothetical protein